MSENSIDEVAEGWWLYYRSFVKPANSFDVPSDETKERAHAAEEYVDNAVKQGDQEAIDLIVKLAETAPDDKAAAYLGAGPLEDLLGHYGHGDKYAQQLVTLARKNRPFRNTLATVLLAEDSLSPESTRILRAFVKIGR